MKATVQKDGLLIPKKMLKGMKQVEIRKEQGRIVVLPVPTAGDPILALGRRPVRSGVAHASEKHDTYIYGTT